MTERGTAGTVEPGKTNPSGETGSGSTEPLSISVRRARGTSVRRGGVRGPAWRPGPARWSAPLARGWWTTPRLVRGLTALCVAALLTAAAVTATVLSGARQGIDDPVPA